MIKYFLASVLIAAASTGYAQVDPSGVSINLGSLDSPEGMVPAVKIFLMLTVLTIAPAILLLTTSFTRILIVLGFIRQALGTQSMPPNQVLLGLALFLTYFSNAPVWEEVYKTAYVPYSNEEISQEVAFDNAVRPVRNFMLANVDESDLSVFFTIAKLAKPKNSNDVPLRVLMPAFIISELKAAFQIGFLVYLPFLVIDMVVSSVLMAMGMMMLPPTVISLPFKLILFILVDGWALIIQQVVKSVSLA